VGKAKAKAKAMDLILTGRLMDAQDSERAGLVSRIVTSCWTRRLPLPAQSANTRCPR